MNERSAYLRLFAVALLWGCNYVISAYLLRSFSPILLSFTRIVFTSIFLLIIALISKGLQKPSRAEWKWLLYVGIFGTLLNQVFYFTGLHHSTAGNASLLIALSPLATAILSRIFLKEKLTFYKVTGSILGLMGVIIIVLFGSGSAGFDLSQGDIYLLLAMLTLSISIIFIRKLSNTLSPFAITVYSTLLGTFLMSPAALVEHAAGLSHFSHSIWLWILLMLAGMVAQGLAGFWWNNGVAVIGAGSASMIMNIPPFFALLIAHFFLGDAIHAGQIVGGMLVLVGVAVSSRKKRVATRTPLSLQA